MKPEHFSERLVEVDGWQVNLTTYKLGEKWHTKADNVSPVAAFARVIAGTRVEAESQALARAKDLLSRTNRHAV